MIIPQVQSLSVPGREVLIDSTDAQPGLTVIIDGSVVTDAGSSPVSLLRPGLVICKKAANSKYYLSTDLTNATVSAQGTVSSGAAIGAGAISKTFIWQYKGGLSQTVTTGGSDNTAALVATALNGNANFAADLIASNAGSTLIITTKRAGADEWFIIGAGTLNNQDGGNLTFTSGANVIGANGEYYVLSEYVQLTDIKGAAADGIASTWRKGRFRTAQLIGLTADAQFVLRARGSVFA